MLKKVSYRKQLERRSDTELLHCDGFRRLFVLFMALRLIGEWTPGQLPLPQAKRIPVLLPSMQDWTENRVVTGNEGLWLLRDS